MSTYAASVTLRLQGCTHAVAVVLDARGPDEAETLAQEKALSTVEPHEGWAVEDCHLFDQVVLAHKPPLPELTGTHPLVLYFGTRADAEEFTALVRQAKPGMVMRHLP